MSLEDDQQKKLNETMSCESRPDAPALGDAALDLARDQMCGDEADGPREKTDQLSSEGPKGKNLEASMPNRLDAARLGQAAHSDYFSALRDSRDMGGGWRAWKIDETVGGMARPDAVYINDEQKRIVVEDLYTGTKADVQTASGPERKSHNVKGWNYSKEPLIQEKLNQGYSFEYANAPWDPRKRLDELN